MFGPISWETMIRPSLNEPVTSPPDAAVASASVEVSPILGGTGAGAVVAAREEDQSRDGAQDQLVCDRLGTFGSPP